MPVIFLMQIAIFLQKTLEKQGRNSRSFYCLFHYTVVKIGTAVMLGELVRVQGSKQRPRPVLKFLGHNSKRIPNTSTASPTEGIHTHVGKFFAHGWYPSLPWERHHPDNFTAPQFKHHKPCGRVIIPEKGYDRDLWGGARR